MQIAITVPVYLSDPLHLDFTRQTIESVASKHDYRGFIVVNYLDPRLKKELDQLASTHWTIINNPKGNTLAAAWNLGVKLSQKKATDFFLFLNNDIVLHPQAIDNLVDFAQEHDEFLLWSGTEHDNLRTLKDASWDGSFAEHPHFSCFMITQETVNTVGSFDENFKLGYFEDNDYHLRILKSGHKAAATTTARFYHYGSRTVAVDDDLRLQIKPAYQQNRQYFIDKWGIDIHGQAFNPPESILKKTFKTPFNNPDKTIKDW